MSKVKEVQQAEPEHDVKTSVKITWQPIILAIFLMVFGLMGYAYKNDMNYLKERLSEISTNQKEFIEKHERDFKDLEDRVRNLEIKAGDK